MEHLKGVKLKVSFCSYLDPNKYQRKEFQLVNEVSWHFA